MNFRLIALAAGDPRSYTADDTLTNLRFSIFSTVASTVMQFNGSFLIFLVSVVYLQATLLSAPSSPCW